MCFSIQTKYSVLQMSITLYITIRAPVQETRVSSLSLGLELIIEHRKEI